MKGKMISFVVILMALLSSSALAYDYGWVAYLAGINEVPPNASPASGVVYGNLNAAGNQFSANGTWGGLLGNYTASHFHGPAVAGVNAGVRFGTVAQGSQTGLSPVVWPIAAVDVVRLYGDSVYYNVHTNIFGGGEIRGQVQCSPDSAVFDAATDIGESQCVQLCEDFDSRIIIHNIPDGAYPVVTKRFGCLSLTNPCDVDCYPTDHIVEYFQGFWHDDNGDWHWYYNGNTFWLIVRGNGCACITLTDILAVELGSFQAIGGDGQVTLNWSTRSEESNDRFEIVRDGQLVTTIPSLGNSATGHDYSWTDRNVTNGVSYEYSLTAVDLNGSRATLATESATPNAEAVVSAYTLQQNFPNPFNPETQIRFDLVDAGHVNLKVFDVTGREVATLVNGEMPRGSHEINFRAAGLTSGLYLYRLDVNGFSDQKKMLFLK